MRYDGAWLATLTARVASVTNRPADYIVWSMPMATAALYDMQYVSMRANDAKIRRRLENTEIYEKYWARLNELMTGNISEDSNGNNQNGAGT